MKYNRKDKYSNPWFVLFEVIAVAICCILFGNYIKGQSSDAVSTDIGNYLMSFGTLVLIAIVFAAVTIIGILYLIYWLFYKPKDKDPYYS